MSAIARKRIILENVSAAPRPANSPQEVREQKKEEAQMLAGALLDAEARMGELLKAIPNLKGRNIPGKSDSGVTLSEYGVSKKQSHQFQQLAQHPDIVEQVKAKAANSLEA
jgi:hypothetical protein